MNQKTQPTGAGLLHRNEFEHENCGIGAVVNIKGVPSHATVDNSLTIVETLEHRAGKDAEGKTGDGVGILLQISDRFFQKTAKQLNIPIASKRDYAVGMFFFPSNELRRNQAKKMFEIIAEKEGVKVLAWREVPCDPSVLGSKARACMPHIMQCFINRPQNVNRGIDFDRKLYVARRFFEQSNEDTYVVSLSSRTIVYKGMFLVGDLRNFYLDLQDPDYESAIALVHSRFSTNTFPSWQKAHPNRMIVHNGEINTIKGNSDKMLAREENMASEHLMGDMDKVLPVVNPDGSDSARLDNTLEFLVMSGMDLPLAVMITIPEPWDNNHAMPQKERDFYQYYATMMEPWDGPASILFSDGDVMGAVLDRNGLRPSRYYITDDDNLILSSEVGALEIAPEKVVKKERLHPGKMLLVDTVQGRLIDDEEIKLRYASRQPYGEWLDANLTRLKNMRVPNTKVKEHIRSEKRKLQKAFGYTYEDVMTTILPMARDGKESIDAMGCDKPLAALSKQPQPLFHYFKQSFAQVTNPPIDAIREEIVTSTTIYIGKDGNLLEEKPDNCKVIKVVNPILTSVGMLKLKRLNVPGFRVAEIPILYYKNTKLSKAVKRLFVEADKACGNGANILILSDRGVDENHLAIPSLLAVSALHQHLVASKRRTSLSIVLESGEPREVHHFAALLAYGASAVNPYLALETIHELIHDGLLNKDYYAAIEDYNDAVLHGVVKIASKMGISTLQSYQGSKNFEALGLGKEMIDEYFPGTVSRIGGITIEDVENTVDALHSAAFDPLGLSVNEDLPSCGGHKSRSGKEEHLYHPLTIHALQAATKNNDYKRYKEYSRLLTEDMEPVSLRGLLDFNYADTPVPLDEVESVDSIVKRFKSGAMSYGSISQEAHEALAIAMNKLGGKSNSGEGGESDERIATKGTKENRCSAIKQVASGRFGVTSAYLNSADEIQIKMAQGAKPGEGGHLPGNKVYPWIAKTRHSTPGVSLISPPPHHDIYSIEDLAQLIYDLKNANKQARISVKLVSEAGVGTVAAGVAKAGAEVILISGYDGGTGAAPRSSIYNAGLPWELGLAEAHQTLLLNGLRDKVIIETDGKLMTGRDVAIAAILGAEEFGFATAPLVTLGCAMMRVCNLDSCPFGVATQNPELRKRFKGKPEYVMDFMLFIAQELREYMSRLGVRTVDELVGRTDLLRRNDKESEIDLSLLLNTDFAGEKISYTNKNKFDFKLGETLDEKVIEKKLKKAKTIEIDIKNTDRSLGTAFGSEITKKFGDSLQDNTYRIICNGSGGQSFGAFIPNGLTMELRGDSNDYFGKGLSGGKLIVYPPKGSKFKAEENIIIGNVALYGATSGKAFINGVAGERFCVRNSGATAVVEGVGEHGCEYMTGGTVVILGRTGKNFAAGMSGGVAYVLDEHHHLYKRLNKELVECGEVTEQRDIDELKALISEHVAATNSEKGKKVLDSFEEYLPLFKKVIPHDYKLITEAIEQNERSGMSAEQSKIEAFYQLIHTKKEESE